jgi:hypothetical protein
MNLVKALIKTGQTYQILGFNHKSIGFSIFKHLKQKRARLDLDHASVKPSQSWWVTVGF